MTDAPSHTPLEAAFAKLLERRITELAVYYNVSLFTARTNDERVGLQAILVNAGAALLARAIVSTRDRDEVRASVIEAMPGLIDDCVTEILSRHGKDFIAAGDLGALQ